MDLPASLKSRFFTVRRQSRDTLLRPGCPNPLAIGRSALAESAPTLGVFERWVTDGATTGQLIDLLPSIQRDRGTPAEEALLDSLTRRSPHATEAWALAALDDPSLHVALRPHAQALCIRAGADAPVSLVDALLAAQVSHRGFEALVSAVVDSATHLDALRSAMEHPELGQQVLHIALQSLVDEPSLSVASLSTCSDVQALAGMLPLSAAGKDTLQAVEAVYPGAFLGKPEAWQLLSQRLIEALAHLPSAPGPLGGWRTRARVVRMLLAQGPSGRSPGAHAAVLVLAAARLAGLPDDDRHFGGPTAPLSTLLPMADRPGLHGHPCVVDALAAHGPGAVTPLVDALDPDAPGRSHIAARALVRLAWQHPGCADASVEAALHLYPHSRCARLVDATVALLASLSPAVVPQLVGAQQQSRRLDPTLSTVIGAIGGPAAEAFLLGHMPHALDDETGILAGLCRLGSPEAIEPLSRLEGSDPNGEVVQALILLCESSGRAPAALPGWRSRLQAIEEETARRRSQLHSQFQALASGASPHRPRDAPERSVAGTRRKKPHKKARRRARRRS